MQTSPKVVIAGTGYTQLFCEIKENFELDDSHMNCIGFLDDNIQNRSRKLMGGNIVGGFSWIKDHKDVLVLNSIMRSMELRKRTTQILMKHGAAFASFIHHSSFTHQLNISEGTFVSKFVSIEPNVDIKEHCCILASSVIAHDSILGPYCFLGHGVHIQGGVEIGEGCFISAGSVILPGVKIGEYSHISPNSVIGYDVPPHSKMFTNFARRINGAQ